MPRATRHTGASAGGASSPATPQYLTDTDLIVEGEIRSTSNLVTAGDATIRGQIKTGTFGKPATFTGIEREGRVYPAACLASQNATMTFDSGVPRVTLAPSVTTDVYLTFALEEWWLDSSLGLYIEWTNDHSATGNVRWQFALTETDIATQTVSQAGTIATKTVTVASPPANGGTNTQICFNKAAGDNIFFTPGPFASFYVLRMSRLGADGADTLAGPAGIIEASYVRGQ